MSSIVVDHRKEDLENLIVKSTMPDFARLLGLQSCQVPEGALKFVPGLKSGVGKRENGTMRSSVIISDAVRDLDKGGFLPSSC